GAGGAGGGGEHRAAHAGGADVGAKEVVVGGGGGGVVAPDAGGEPTEAGLVHEDAGGRRGLAQGRKGEADNGGHVGVESFKHAGTRGESRSQASLPTVVASVVKTVESVRRRENPVIAGR